MSAVPDTHRAIDAVWRIESARLIAGLARIVRDVGRAEDLAQEALVAALEQWPKEGIPDNPGAWLMATAKHRAIDAIRHEQMAERKREEIAAEMDVIHDPDLDAQADDDIGDDLLTLIFTACHPVLNTEGRIALTLRLVGALTTPEIARAFVVPEKTMAQRIVRAKKTLQERRRVVRDPARRRARRAAGVGAARWSTRSSTRATRPRRATTGCARR